MSRYSTARRLSLHWRKIFKSYLLIVQFNWLLWNGMECHFLMLQKIPSQYLPKWESCYDFDTSRFATSVASDPLTHLPRDNLAGKFADIFRCIFCEENVWISIKIPLRFVPKGPIDSKLALVQVMACRRTGDKRLLNQYSIILNQLIDAYMRH